MNRNTSVARNSARQAVRHTATCSAHSSTWRASAHARIACRGRTREQRAQQQQRLLQVAQRQIEAQVDAFGVELATHVHVQRPRLHDVACCGECADVKSLCVGAAQQRAAHNEKATSEQAWGRGTHPSRARGR